jgi:gamma-glutamylcyclotransferase
MSEKVFAYGSNMCSGRFRDYKIVPEGPGRAGVLLKYRLVFNKRGQDGSGKASVEPDSGAKVWGVLYTIPDADLKTLDAGEGPGYRRVKMQIRTTDADATEAWVYIASRPDNEPALHPYTWYKRFLVEGAREHFLPPKYVAELKSIEAVQDPNGKRDRTKRALVCGAAPRSLVFTKYNGKQFVGAQLSMSGDRIDTVARQVRFFDSVMALAELPKMEELPGILAQSQQSGITAIWTRARPSPLESNVTAFLTTLAFSNHNDWVRLVRQFFKAHSLKVGTRGRPPLHRAQQKHMTRGFLIDGMIERLGPGVLAKLADSGDEPIEVVLTGMGYSSQEIQVILQAKNPRDAGCRLFYATMKHIEHVDLKTIRNSYARYQSLRTEKRHTS